MKARQILNLIENFDKQEFFEDIILYFIKKFKIAGCNISMTSNNFPMALVPNHIENLYLNTVDNNYDMSYRYILNLKRELKNSSLLTELRIDDHLIVSINDVPFHLSKFLPTKTPLFMIESSPIKDETENNFKFKIQTIVSFTREFKSFFREIAFNIERHTKSLLLDKQQESIILDDLKNEIKKRIDLVARAIRLTEFGEVT